MKLPSERFSSSFSAPVWEQGKLLSEKALRTWGGDDRIVCEFPEDNGIVASLEISDKLLVPHCECKTFAAGKCCAHLAAALLLADRFEDLGKALQRNIPPRLVIPRLSSSADSDEVTYTRETTASPRKRIRATTDEEGRIIERVTESSKHPPFLPPITVGPCNQEILYVVRCDKMPSYGTHLVVDTWWRPVSSEGEPPQQAKPLNLDSETLAPTQEDAQILNALRRYKITPGNRYQVPLDDRGVFESLAFSSHLKYTMLQEGKIRMKPLSFLWQRESDVDIQMKLRQDGMLELFVYLVAPENLYSFLNVEWIAVSEHKNCGQEALGIAFCGGTLFKTRFAGGGELLAPLVGKGRRVMEFAEAAAFARNISVNSDISTAGFPEALAIHRQNGLPVGQLYVRTAKFLYQGLEQLHAELSYDYDGIICAENETNLKVASTRLVVVRNLEAEDKLKERLKSLGFRYVTKAYQEEPGWKLHPSLLDNAVHTLTEEGWCVTAEGKTYRKPTTKKPVVQSGIDWFDVKAGVSFDGQEVPLPALLAAFKSGSKTVRLDDGTLGLLPLQWLAEFTVLTQIGECHDEKLRFRIQQAQLVTAILGERIAEGEQRLQEQLHSFEKISQVKEATPPADFQATLRPYQAFGFGWLKTMQNASLGACLADDMGLGKTIQVLSLLAERRAVGLPSLIVVPKSLIFNWLSEVKKFAPFLTTLVHTGAGRSCDPAHLSQVNLVFTTYGTLRNDATALAKMTFDYCILDESQAIKSHDSSTAKAARCIQAHYRIAMTGTPIENNLSELFSQLDFLNPGLFGAKWFAANPSPQNKWEDSLLEKVHRAVKPFLLRRTKSEVAKELPPKVEQILWCQLSPEEQTEYDELLAYYQKELQEGSAGGSGMQALAALTRLRQAACHPGLIKSARASDSSSKLELLAATLEEVIAAGHKALIFSQFTSFLKIIRARLESVGYGLCYLDGETKDRAQVVENFQKDDTKKLFLISLKAGGVGLNLTSADYVFIMDPWWNPAAESQAIDRAYRIGQKRNVMAYRLVTKNTVEEKVVALQNAKRSLADAVIDESTALPTSLTKKDLEALLRG